MKALRKVLTALILSVTVPCMAARADYITVVGTVADASDGSACCFATLALYRNAELVAAVSADAGGKFEMKAIPGTYTLKVGLMGYKDYEDELNLFENSSRELKISLQPDAEMLSAAKVSDKVPVIEMKADKIVMNVSHSAFAQGSNGLDLLKKAPGVTIDKDGNVKLNGNPVSVWIDGRPSYLSGEALKNLLKGTSGTTIDKIEVIANPSAKYDAEGQGGIINIKTRRSSLQGLNGTLTLDGGGMYRSDLGQGIWNTGANANINYRSAKNSTNLIIGRSWDHNLVSMGMDTEMPTSSGLLKSSSNSLLRSDDSSTQLQLSSDFFLDSKNTVGFIVSAPGSWSTMDSPLGDNSYLTTLDGLEISRSNAEIINHTKSPRYSGNLNWTRIFDPAKASEMTVNIDYLRNGSYNTSRQTNHDLSGGSESVTEREVTTGSEVDLVSAKADWQGLVFGQYMLEAGGKWAWSHTGFSNKHIETGLPDINDGFIYNEHIGAAYATLAGQFGQKLSGKIGLRAEYTIANGDWNSDGEPYSNNYLDLFPNVNIAYMASPKTMFALTYNRRIGRPKYSQLNPSKVWLDANNTICGNRDLQPEYSDNISVVGSFNQIYALYLGFQYRTNMINQMPSFDAMGHEQLIWSNVGRQMGVYLSMNVNEMPITKWMNWTLNLTGMTLRQMDVPTLSDDWKCAAQFYTSLSFSLPANWRIDWDAFGMSKMNWGYFVLQPYAFSSVAVKKTILDNKMTLSLKFDDIFDSSAQQLKIMGAEGVSNSMISQHFYARKVGVSLSWNFGQSQKARKRNVGNVEESSRLGSSSSLGK